MDIHRIQSDPRHQPSVRRVGRTRKDGDQEQDFSEALAEGEAETGEEDPPTTDPPKSTPPGSGEEGLGGRLDVLG